MKFSLSFTVNLFFKLKSLERKVYQYETPEFSRTVLCHQLWLKTEVDEIRKDINYAE